MLLSGGKDFSIDILVYGYLIKVHVTILLFLAAALALNAVRELDLKVYHKMLRGAVTFGEDFEERYMKEIFGDLEKGMTQSISHFSRYESASVVSKNNKLYNYLASEKRNAYDKVSGFYNLTTSFLIISSCSILFFQNWPLIEV